MAANFGFSKEEHERIKQYFLTAVLSPGRGSIVGRTTLEAKPVQIADVLADPEYTLPATKIGNYRTALGIPLLREGVPIGVLVLMRSAPQSFTDKQIELLTTFADQAVIAIENTRLFEAEQQRTRELRQRTTDLTEALEQQTATSEVLQVISSSPGDLEPVFVAILDKAVRICGAKFGVLFLSEGDAFRSVALHGAPPEYADARRRVPIIRPNPDTAVGRVAATKKTVQIADIRAEPAYTNDPERSAILKLAGARTMLTVPMLKEEELVGQIAIYRQEVRPFSEKQIELVQNFAAQAVIAIENTRLLNELRKSLQQQTATSDVLKVISSSPGALEPVFKALLENATQLCGASYGNMYLCEGDAFRSVALHGVLPAAYTERWGIGALFQPGPDVPLARAAKTRQPFQIADIRASDGDPLALSAVNDAGILAVLAVPMLKESDLVSAIVIYSKEARPFTGKQIELLENFAAQAVIAIENSRLLSELRQRTTDLSKRTADLTEALEQQAATSDILSVISGSPGQLEPVFQAILANATRICEANFGILNLFDGNTFQNRATHGIAPEYMDFLKRNAQRADPRNTLGRLVETREPVHVADLRLERAYLEREPTRVGVVEIGGARTLLAVPMVKETRLIGAIVIYRKEVRPFTDKQVDLVKNFADQAVIAIENARLLNELRESLQQQTATADVLKVISRSTFDLQTVLDTLVELAAQLCAADKGAIQMRDGHVYRIRATYGYAREAVEYGLTHPLQVDRSSLTGRVALEGKAVHIHDASADPEYRAGYERAVGFKTALGVPLLREGTTIGVFGLTRDEVNPFSEKQIELVTTFADQAVIAIENVRLFEAEQQRTRELSESLEQQTATSDVLRVISKSPTDIQPVLDTIGERAEKLCNAELSGVWIVDGELIRLASAHGLTEAGVEAVRRASPQRRTDETVARAIRTRSVCHVSDVLSDPQYQQKDTARISGYRGCLGVPMVRDEQVVGAIFVAKRQPGLFSDTQVQLLKTFADQAVIAIENVRLFKETKISLEQQTATADVLKIISRSTFDLRTVLQTLVESAARFCDADKANIIREKDGVLLYRRGLRLLPRVSGLYKKYSNQGRPRISVRASASRRSGGSYYRRSR